ncbi:hypothetical protein OSS47_00380 [Pseudomonas citronellolis]|nr:hypothetical protein OSS47_00380 [Pseudomonas citronellolis]
MGQRAHALVNFGDLADLALLLGQHAGLQTDQLLGVTGGLLRGISALGLEIDARGQSPPDEPGSQGDQQASDAGLHPDLG